MGWTWYLELIVFAHSKALECPSEGVEGTRVSVYLSPLHIRITISTTDVDFENFASLGNRLVKLFLARIIIGYKKKWPYHPLSCLLQLVFVLQVEAARWDSRQESHEERSG